MSDTDATDVSSNSPAPHIAAGEYSCLLDRGSITHILVPTDVFERLLSIEAFRAAVSELREGRAGIVSHANVGRELAATRLVTARRRKGLTQTELAHRIGLTQSQVSRAEREPAKTSKQTLRCIAEQLGVNISALLDA